ncbi:MAG: radical SAM protein [Schaedlerella sp.]|nr:radical SAM protein [Schaedlerella sp.]
MMESFEGATTVERAMMSHASKTKTPINGSIELLPLCNMNCDMCYVRLSREEMEEKGRLRTADEWIEIGKQMQKAGVLFLLLTGGEPLLFPEFKRLYLEFRKMGFILTINTNGTLIDEEWARFFAEHKPRRINITIYGSSEKEYEELCHYPGGFEKVINAIRLLKQYGIDVKASGSATKTNKDSIEQIIKIGTELDVPVRVDTYMLPATRERNKPYNEQARLTPEEAADIRVKALRMEMGEEMFADFVKQKLFVVDHMIPDEAVPSSMNCYAGKCSFSINWQGEMHPCVILTEPATNVFEHGFEKAWERDMESVGKILLNAKCTACRMSPLCRTCAASALCETGSYDGIPDYMCRYTKETIRLMREYLKDTPENS